MNQQIKDFGKKFIKKGWAIGYREVEKEHEINLKAGPDFSMILPKKNEWYADPFPVKYQDKSFIFAEVMDENTHRGHIGVMRIGDESEQFVPIIKEPFHMSFPNVFFANNEWYMIPETNKAKQIRLYHAVDFPYKWELESILIEGEAFVDTVIYRESEECFLLEAYDVNDRNHEYNRFYRFYVRTKNMEEIKFSNGSYVDKRPGGNFVRDRNGLKHVLQNCDRMYGKYMHMAMVNRFDASGLEEEECYTVHARDIHCNKKRLYLKTHTYNRWEELEVVDLFYYRFSISF